MTFFSLTGDLITNNLLDVALNHRHFGHNHIPHEVVIYPQIVMNQPVAHSRHSAPVNMTVLVPDFLRDLFCSLTNDLKTAHKGAFQRFVAQKPCFGEPPGMGHQILSFTEDVLQKWEYRMGHIQSHSESEDRERG